MSRRTTVAAIGTLVAALVAFSGQAAGATCPLGYGLVETPLNTGAAAAVAPAYGTQDARWAVKFFVPGPAFVVEQYFDSAVSWVTPPSGSAWISNDGAGTGHSHDGKADSTISYATSFHFPAGSINRRINVRYAIDNTVTFSLDGAVVGHYAPPWWDEAQAFNRLHTLSVGVPASATGTYVFEAFVTDFAGPDGVLVVGSASACVRIAP